MAETKKSSSNNSTTKSSATKSSTTKPATKSATTKSSTSKTNTTKKSSSPRKRTFWGLNKISFWLLGAAAILYLIGLILSAIDASKLATAVSVMQALATALMICVVAVLGWRYVRSKPTVWLVLYFTFMLVIVAGIIVPMCIR